MKKMKGVFPLNNLLVGSTVRPPDFACFVMILCVLLKGRRSHAPRRGESLEKLYFCGRQQYQQCANNQQCANSVHCKDKWIYKGGAVSIGDFMNVNGFLVEFLENKRS